jgi:hypothetical protein
MEKSMSHTHIESKLIANSRNPIFVATVVLDCKYSKKRGTTILELGGGSSNFSGYSQAYPGQNLSIMIIEELLTHPNFEFVFLVSNGPETVNYYTDRQLRIIEHYSAHPHRKVIICTNHAELLNKYDKSIHKNNNCLVVGLVWRANLALKNLLASNDIDLPVLSSRDLLEACFDDKTFFYHFHQKQMAEQKAITPTTFLLTKGSDIERCLGEIKSTHVIFKIPDGTMGKGACILDKKSAAEFAPLILENCHFITVKEDAALTVKIQELRNGVRSANGDVLLQEVVQSDSLDDDRYDYTARAVYNVYWTKNSEGTLVVTPTLVGVYCKLPKQPKTGSVLTTDNMISYVDDRNGIPARPFPEAETRRLDAELQSFLKDLIRYTHQASLIDYVGNIEAKSPEDKYVIQKFKAGGFSCDLSHLTKLNPANFNEQQLTSFIVSFKMMVTVFRSKATRDIVDIQILNLSIILQLINAFNLQRDRYRHQLTDLLDSFLLTIPLPVRPGMRSPPEIMNSSIALENLLLVLIKALKNCLEKETDIEPVLNQLRDFFKNPIKPLFPAEKDPLTPTPIREEKSLPTPTKISVEKEISSTLTPLRSSISVPLTQATLPIPREEIQPSLSDSTRNSRRSNFRFFQCPLLSNSSIFLVCIGIGLTAMLKSPSYLLLTVVIVIAKEIYSAHEESASSVYRA